MKLIAETAWHHEGDVNFLFDLAKAIENSSADIAKYHITLDIEEYIDNSHAFYDKCYQWKIDKARWREF